MDTEDLSASRDLLDDLDRSAARLGRTLSASLAAGVRGGKDLRGVLYDLQGRLSALAVQAAFRPVGEAIAGSISSLGRALGAALAGAVAPGGALAITQSARGNVVGEGRVRPFAQGGVVAAPTYFPMRGSIGLMGERGAEAILPLSRGSDGRLGVAAGATPAPVVVNVAITTPDVAGFRRSEAELTAQLARAVVRGRRGM
jgi:phage-related minor tail protein